MMNEEDIKKLAERAFDAGADIENWLEKSGRPSDHPGYDDFEEWWERHGKGSL